MKEKIYEINGGVFGSTGKIMFGIADRAKQESMETRCASPITVTNRFQSPSFEYYKIGTYNSRRISVFLGRVTGFNGCFAFFSTYKLIKDIKIFAPSIIHLHNLHESYVNIPMLLHFIKKNNYKVVWTLHDCWAFTGNCPYFTYVNCNKWKYECSNCMQYDSYPKMSYDNTKKMYHLKKKWFSNLDMNIVVPSKWLNKLVKESFLRNYPIQVIHNGIDLELFKPTVYCLEYRIYAKYIILGVSFAWEDERKGLDVFIEMANKLDDRFQIILVGTNENIDKKLPNNITSIHRTNNQLELAQLYSRADVFANPTREDNYPTVNMESLACGTPVITFKTGGSPEMIDKSCGRVVEYNNTEAFINEVINICENTPFTKENCLQKAKEFNMCDRYYEYVELFKKIKGKS